MVGVAVKPAVLTQTFEQHSIDNYLCSQWLGWSCTDKSVQVWMDCDAELKLGDERSPMAVV